MAKKLIIIRYIVALVMGLFMGLCSESFTKLMTLYVIQNNPGWYSQLSIIVGMIGCIQFLTTKMKLKESLWLPFMLVVVETVVIILLISYGNIKHMLLFNMLAGAIIGIMLFNRKNKIMDILKHSIPMDKIYNTTSSLMSVGSISGYTISSVLLTKGVTNLQLIIIMVVSTTVVVLPLMILENILAMRLFKSTTEGATITLKDIEG